ncbi:MAG: hypothetical protein AAGI11_15070 [Pseudomonadota bacterium]
MAKDEPFLIIDSCGWLWRPDSAGYTASLAEAGLYTEKEARATERSTDGDHKAISLREYVSDRRINFDVVRALASLAHGEETQTEDQINA